PWVVAAGCGAFLSRRGGTLRRGRHHRAALGSPLRAGRVAGVAGAKETRTAAHAQYRAMERASGGPSQDPAGVRTQRGVVGRAVAREARAPALWAGAQRASVPADPAAVEPATTAMRLPRIYPRVCPRRLPSPTHARRRTLRRAEPHG